MGTSRDDGAVDREADRSGLEQMLLKIRETVCDGLQHGFFDIRVHGELLAKRQRSVTVRAGRLYRFVIAAAEFERPR
jgi:hypothetical protein